MKTLMVSGRVFDLLMALPINFQNHIFAICQGFFYPAFGRTVLIVKDECMFQKVVMINHALKFSLINKVIIDAIYFARTLVAGGVRDGNSGGRQGFG